MKLIEMLSQAVRPRVHENFSNIALVVPEFDTSEEEVERLDAIERIGGLSVIIEYSDSKGATSQRLITCKKLSVRAGKEYISAFCHHREAPRSFRIDRITDIFDAQTGESLSPAQAFFASFEPDVTAKSGLSWGLSVGRRIDLIALLNALVFIARCDKDFHPSERQVIEEALTSFWMRLEIMGDPDFDDIMKYADKLAPDGETFWAAMHRFKEDVDLRNIFSRHANMLIQADGVIDDRETYWSIEISDFFND
ncbi:MAG: WYL domain-containing protein [Erythrobacter sp.]|uniref:WYL domain-containing protein n=1 Tax=Erythrobacter sp. TaxID=1042 RepID=UPI003A8783D5